MAEELLYLGLLVKLEKDRAKMQYELSLARGLVCKKYPGVPQQVVQESFEELALCLQRNLLLPRENRFRAVAIQYLREN